MNAPLLTRLSASGLARLDRERPEGAAPLGWRCFQLGLFVLPSSALIAGLLLLVALIQGSRGRSPWWRDRCNQLLALVAGLMVCGALSATLQASQVPAYPPSLAWAGLFNWLPFFWAFWGFQPYLADSAARRRVALALVAGTVPVVVTGLGQLFLGWHGPWQILGGAVIWHVREGGNPPQRLAGLFDYANVAGSWLSLTWPFLLAALLSCRRRLRLGSLAAVTELVVLLALTVAQVAALVLTDSRNAWGAVLLAIPLVVGPGSWLWLLPVLALSLLPVLLAVLPGVPAAVQVPMRELVPQSLWGRLNDVNSHGDRPVQITRLMQWSLAVEWIQQRPWLGWGAAAYSVLYPLRTGFSLNHAHNIAVDLALSFGIPVALLLVGLVLWLLLRGARRGMTGASTFDRAWWASALVLASLHAADIPMYDSRLNIAGWVLLAGLRCWR